MAKIAKAGRNAPRKYLASNSRKFLIWGTALILVVGAIVGVAAYYGYKNDQAQKKELTIAADEARFSQVEADMEAAHAMIVSAVGKPAHEEASKSCSHVALKFEKGQLSCGVSRKLVYGVGDRAELVRLFISIVRSIESTGRFAIGVDAIDPPLDRNDDVYKNGHYLRANFHDGNKITCKLSVNQYDSKLTSDYLYVDSAVIADFIFGCREDMTYPIYPLAE